MCDLHAVSKTLAALHHNAWGHRVARMVAEETVIVVDVALHGGHERPQMSAAIARGLGLVVSTRQEELKRELLA
ncbi:MAG: hypothetical protein HC767_14775 [Akkermansiaceae bacterium]|nr:hypothetical protein [Akkermansiaceae bacterium]